MNKEDEKIFWFLFYQWVYATLEKKLEQPRFGGTAASQIKQKKKPQNNKITKFKRKQIT